MGMLSKIIRLKKNSTFNYNPRYYKDKGKGYPFKLEHKFDEFRSTVDTPRGLKGKFGSAMEDMQKSGDHNLKMRMVIIISILVLIFLYIIDFDLSIFFEQ
ncbi:MAG: riboflavin synthase subunit beta [Flavobacteriaceae bacterium]